ncbi:MULTISPECIES: helix-turn-helix domain-containing protein [unclassified Arthrobacter]|uniref:helix-turn-helix domain-containing protein n=1 Tax=unclassified Arthrobacter TaxID=235627 RepID=UPI0009DFBF7D
MKILNTEPWVGVPAVARHLDRSKDWVRKYARHMPHHRVGREYRFRLSEVDKWLESWRGGDRVE